MMIRAAQRRLAFSIGIALTVSAAAQAACFPTAEPIAGWGGALQRSVVVNDPAVFARRGQARDFSLGATLGAILVSAGVTDTQAERIALLQGMVRSFSLTEFVNREGGLPQEFPTRPGEAGLDPAALLGVSSAPAAHRDRLRPVAVFNRLDLAPADWSTCGEYRIVYAKGDGVDPLDRMTLIFEAAMRNPGRSEAACRPVAAFWQGLSDPNLGADEIALRLADFFYRGDLNGDGTSDLPGGGAVIQAAHLGQEIGQVRANLFVSLDAPGANPWQLREWHVAIGADGAPRFAPAAVEQNPLPALYATGAPSDPLTERREDFAGVLVGRAAANLTALDADPATSRDALLARMGAGFPPSFDAFLSIAQGRVDDPAAQSQGNAALRDGLAARLAGLPGARACAITTEHLLNRAGAMSCGGCHQFSVGREVAPGLAWPSAAAGGFVHVTETGALSAALTAHFLPERHRNLTAFLQRTAPVPALAATAAASPPMPGLRAALQAAPTRADRQALLLRAEDEAAANRTRAAEQPGAFMPARRSH
jgi:hypothetical protein